MPTRPNSLEEEPLTKGLGVNLGLPRPESLLTTRSDSRKTSLADKTDLRLATWIDPLRSGCRIPNELLDEVIKFYFDGVIAITEDRPQVVFSRDITPLTLVSKNIRYFILRRFFRKLSFLTQQDAKEVFDYLTLVAASFDGNGGVTWVKSLSVPAFLLPQRVFPLKDLKNLQDLTIDCSHCILSSQDSILSRLFDTLSDENNLVPNLRYFMMTDVPRLDDGLLKKIATALPQVVNLHVSTVEGIEMSCCQDCYEASLSRVLHSPSDIYANGEDMAKSFALALQLFSKLKNIHLGILLSDCHLLDNHTQHDVKDNDATMKSIPNCPRCAKYAQETRRRELSTGLAIASHLPSLETISWATVFPLSRDRKRAEESCAECDLDKYPKSLQYSIINTNHPAEDLDDDHWKLACFGVQRTKDKIRLFRTA